VPIEAKNKLEHGQFTNWVVHELHRFIVIPAVREVLVRLSP